ncbi:hypothetical protein [Cellulomonas phragmiteti]|uniref:Uncharacterized protein n=1 Tax=Cellulomonas phragmiteti TaxID=478780 RepID=A0ABQ4DRE6_9CELL|nr:hypothetical protein [Cellulomonas phragmiteti]GIG41913.1 hypothetical protein Cph01nite_36750 [Cellulomonas phragmiteti]
MRTHRTRALAEAALARLVARLDGRTDGLVVIGGLNPELLAPVTEAPHQGTADIDLVVQLGFVYDRDELDLRWLESALDATGFAPVGESRAWQWVTTVDDTPVRIDLLTDVLDHRGQQLAVPGCTRMTVMNVAGPAPALQDPVIRRVAVTSGDDPPTWVDVPFANLGAYLLAKAAAVLGRQADRDPYDLAFVVRHNSAGGPRAAARAARAALPAGREKEFDGVLRAALRSSPIPTDAPPVSTPDNASPTVIPCPSTCSRPTRQQRHVSAWPSSTARPRRHPDPTTADRSPLRRPPGLTRHRNDSAEIHVRYGGLGGFLLAKAAGTAARRALPSDRALYLAASFRSCLTGMIDVESAPMRAYAEQPIRDGVANKPLTIRLDVPAAARACLTVFDATEDPPHPG